MQAADRRVPDVIAPGLAVLFCGINPGLYSAWAAHHFARPGNRFWPTLHAAGFTPRRFAPAEERGLLELGYGITNIVPRATTAAAQLAPDELARGARLLEAKVQRFAPRAVAVLGIGAYRSAFGRPRAGLGRQPDDIGGALAWVLPNPSGLNASYRPADLVRLFAELRDGVEGLAGRSGSGR
jgi:TDG/mug DNA glycosylase family protein